MTDSTAPHILVIDDDPSIRDLVGTYLTKNDLRVTTAATGRELFALVDREPIDLVLLDLKLPGEDGMQLAGQLRERATVPIVLLTGRDEEADRVMGLELGADDYVTKPFSPRELVARVRALLRRAERSSAPAEDPIRIATLSIDPATRQVSRNGREAHLTPTEFDLLYRLARAPRVVFGRARLLEEVWGHKIAAGERTVDSHVRAIRNKLGPGVIRTVHGVGYALDLDDVA